MLLTVPSSILLNTLRCSVWMRHHKEQMRLTYGILAFIALMVVPSADAQSCKPVPHTTETRWGGNEVIEVDFRDHPVRTVHGVARLAGGLVPSDDVLLQVYKRNHTDSLYRAPQPGDPLPVAACLTGNDGAFRFELPNGEYEIRASMNKGMDVTHVYITVSHGLHRLRRIFVDIHPGT
jgi:hypothetical protein